MSDAHNANPADLAHDRREQASVTVDGEELSVLAELLGETIASLRAQNVAPEDLQRLSHVASRLGALATAAPSQAQSERRGGDVPASDLVLARACATIDLLVMSGQTVEGAVQILARQLIASGLKLPEKGGDARGWRRLLEVHRNFRKGDVSAEAMVEYRRFRELVDTVPAGDRINYIISERLWDRRAERATDRRAG